MRLRNQLLFTGLPLLVLPVAVSLVIVWFTLDQSTLTERGAFLQSQVNLVQNRIEWDFDLLSRAGLQDDGFYQANVVERLDSTLHRLVDSQVLILSHQRQVLVGPPGWRGKVLPEGGALQVLFSQPRGQLAAPVDFDPTGQPWLLAWDRFTEWNWTVVALVPVAQVRAPILAAVGGSLAATLAVLGLGVVIFVVFSRLLTRPLTTLQGLAQDLGDGRMDRRAQVAGSDEVAQLALQWNQMADHIQGLTQGLEERVAERTRELKETQEATQAMQVQLLQSEKMAALGQVVAGVAHELSSPLAAISSAGGILRVTLEQQLFTLLGDWSSLAPREQSLVRGLLERSELTGYRSQNAGRMAERKILADQLAAAGCPNPSAIGDGLVDAGLGSLEVPEAAALAGPRGPILVAVLGTLYAARFSGRIIGSAADRAGKVIHALRDYSRFDAERQTSCVRIDESLEGVLTLLSSRLRNGIEVVRDLAPDSRVLADPDRLGQLWINLIGNALQAMDGRGTLVLRSEADGKGLRVQVIDSGPGIPLELQGQIFQPYFTTKKRGEGTGLGLMICRSIVQECGGTLRFESRPGRTLFEARFPDRC